MQPPVTAIQHFMTLPNASNSRPLHVLVVSNHWSKTDNNTNGSIWVDRQVNALRKLGVQVSTFNIGHEHAPTKVFRKWRELRQTVRRLQPDLVHARYGTLVGTLSVSSGAPSVITYAGSDLLPGAGGISKTRIRTGICLSNLAALRANALIAVSDELRRALWWRSHETIVIPDGVDLEVFRPHPQEEARHTLGWNKEEVVVLIDAKRDPERKGLSIAQSAMDIVKARFPKARLQVLQVSNPADMPLHCSAADIFLCASRTEGSPNMVKEAMACNLPVVSTPVGDVPDLLARVHPSEIVPRNAQALGEAMVRILQKPKRSNGHDHCQSFNLTLIAQRVLAVCRSVVDRRPARAGKMETPFEPA
jgi:teichuronic acid biosynthesis glycosyltransferase TuaC